MSLDSRFTIHDSRPGRSCPLSYRYPAASLAREPEIVADTLYVVGGLYGNRTALQGVLELAQTERDRAVVVFNGDFNWFNIDAEGFETVNRTVLEHVALRGNVETELAVDDPSAGCGCTYPGWVSDREVECSNAIISRLRDTSRAFPALRKQLHRLPMNLVARVGDTRVAIVHGDAESLSGWGFSQEALDDASQRDRISRWFDEAQVNIFASSHTCLPIYCELPAGRVLANNGAAGMPNFVATRHGIVTRIGTAARTTDPGSLHSLRAGRVHIDALPVHYDAARFEREFLANWPEGSPAHTSYYQRIVRGPSYAPERASRRIAPAGGRHRTQPLRQEGLT